MFLAAACAQPGTCWHPGLPPAWTWLIYLAIAIFAGLIILADSRTAPEHERGRSRTALLVWIGSVVLFGGFVGVMELYTNAIAP